MLMTILWWVSVVYICFSALIRFLGLFASESAEDVRTNLFGLVFTSVTLIALFH